MSVWYYADAANARQGPVEAAELVRLRLQGRLGWETLVWREGLADWRPMREFAAELAQADDRGPLPATGDGAVTATSRAAASEPALPHAASPATASGDPDPVLAGEIVHAGFWKRFAAMVIDGFVTTAASWALQIPLFLLAGAAGAMDGDPLAGGPLGLILLSYAIGLAVPLFYFAWMHSSRAQASLGKMAVGIKVTRGSGERISFWRAFGRYWAYVLTVVFTFGIGALVSAFTTGLGARRQALHDMICDTLVVDRWAFTDRPDLQRRELGAVAWVAIVVGGALMGLALLGIVAAIAIPALYG